jgi:hypothetical protein
MIGPGNNVKYQAIRIINVGRARALKNGTDEYNDGGFYYLRFRLLLGMR